MSTLIYTSPDGNNVATMSPPNPKAVPAGVEYEVVSSELTLPGDNIFYMAWRWEGKGKPVLEDLEVSKEIAIAQMRQQTLQDTNEIATDLFFDETVVRTAEDVKATCLDTEAAVKACTDTYSVKLLLCAFMDWDEPGQPRVEVLKDKGVKAAAKLRAKIADIRREIHWRIVKAQRKQELLTGRPSTMPASEKSLAKK